jgi:hypothetical protein
MTTCKMLRPGARTQMAMAYSYLEYKLNYIRIILEELGHKQPPTPLQTDNAMADAVINGKVQPKRTIAMDIRFHYRECQQQFRIYWRPGKIKQNITQKHIIGTYEKFLTPHIVIEFVTNRATAEDICIECSMSTHDRSYSD